ncbi:MAG: MotA/TolQ/ExbB proton channel family protein [Phycisphaerales bacterium]
MHQFALEVNALSGVLGQAPVDAGAASIVGTVWQMIMKGGWIMLPLGLCSLVALTIVVERLLVTRASRLAPPGQLESLLAVRGQAERSLAECRTRPSPLAEIIGACLREPFAHRARQEELMSEAGARQVRILKQRLRVLSCLPQTATMLGLLGTVAGMIRTFTVIAASGEALGKTERLAQGIYEAWTATAVGLGVAIPTMLFYHIIQSRVDHATALLDSLATRWLDAPAAPMTSAEIAEPPAGLRGAGSANPPQAAAAAQSTAPEPAMAS